MSFGFPNKRRLTVAELFNLIHEFTRVVCSMDMCFVGGVGKGFVQRTFSRRLLSVLYNN